MKKLPILLILCCMGCSMFPQRPPATRPATQAENLIATTMGMNGWVIISIATIVLGVVSMLNGSKSASLIIVGGAVALGLILTVARYANTLALLCLVGSVGWVVYSLFVDGGFLTLRRKK